MVVARGSGLLLRPEDLRLSVAVDNGAERSNGGVCGSWLALVNDRFDRGETDRSACASCTEKRSGNFLRRSSLASVIVFGNES